MEFISLHAKNFKSISDEHVSFESGVLVVHGQNGAGKTSFLEAAFFALYGSDALPSHSNLEDVIKKGEDELSVTLTFSHDGTTYQIERELERRQSGSPTHSCLLQGGNYAAESITEAEQHIEELLRMDATSFLNCAYVRQGEIKLVEATPSEREEMIDRLLQLGQLESYRERANKIRLGAKNVRENREALLDDVESEIDELEDEGLPEKLERLNSEIDSLEQEREELKRDLQDAESERDDAQDRIDELGDTADRIDELEQKVAEIEEKLRDDREERDSLQEQLKEHRAEREGIASDLAEALDGGLTDASFDDIDGGEAEPPAERYDTEPIEAAVESAKERREEVTDDAMDKRSRKQSLEGEAQQHRNEAQHRTSKADEREAEADDLRTERDEIGSEKESVEEQIEAAKEEFDDSPPSFGDAEDWLGEVEEEIEGVEADIRDAEKELAAARDSVETAEELLDEGKCPECGQSVDGSPHVEDLDEQREEVERLEGELDDLQDERDGLEEQREQADHLVDAEERVEDLREEAADLDEEMAELESDIDEKEDEAESLREEATDLREQAVEKEDEAQQVADEIEELKEEREEVEDRLAELEEVEDTVGQLVDVEKEIGHAEDKLSGLNSVIEEREERLSGASDELQSLRDDYDESELEAAKERKQEAIERAGDIQDEIDDLDDQLSEKRGDRGRVSEKLDTLEEKREKRDRLESDVERLESAEMQAEDVKAMYGNLREELREKNVAKLEQLFNEVFMDLYQNDTYERIELTNEYEITIHDKEEGELSPQMLSGGEKVMFNLALRCAIYQLLAEASSGEEASAPSTLPPLILDEPTAHLDDTHVTQLTEIVELMRDLGVDQTIVVSHQEEVVASSDVTFRVDLNSTTNSSTVERKHAGQLSR